MAKKRLVDLNIVTNGEVVGPLHRLLQEIEIVMTANGYILTMLSNDMDLDKYLFKTAVNETMVAQRVQQLINDNVDNIEGYIIEVTAKFMKGLQAKDTLILDTAIFLKGELQEQMIYAVTP